MQERQSIQRRRRRLLALSWQTPREAESIPCGLPVALLPIEHSEGKSAGNHLIALACTQSAITIWLSRYGALRERDIVKSPERPSLRVRRPLFFLGQQYTTEIEAAPGVHPAKARRIAANIAKLPEAVIRSVELIRP